VTGFSPLSGQQIRQAGRKIGAPVAARLQAIMTCGLTPKKLALTICLGIALGIMPLIWGTTVLCIVFAHILKLNHAALQSINYLLYPAQLALLLPFYKLGSRLFSWGPPVPAHIVASLMHAPGDSVHLLGWILAKSLAAWLVTVVPIMLSAYGIYTIVTSKRNSTPLGL